MKPDVNQNNNDLKRLLSRFRIKNYLKITVLSLSGLLVLVSYQNCTSSGFSTASNQGGSSNNSNTSDNNGTNTGSGTGSGTGASGNTKTCSLNNLTYNPGAILSGYVRSSAVSPTTCGEIVARVCQTTGVFDGSVPLFQTCDQQCLHPDNSQPVDIGFQYNYYSISNAATQAECDAAMITSSCSVSGLFSPTIPSQKFKTCLVAGQTCAYTNGTGISMPNGNSVGSTVQGYVTQSATYPMLCGAQKNISCQGNGSWSDTVPVYTNCLQKCIHPDSKQPVDQNSTYAYYTLQNGTQAQCDAAKITTTCSSSTGQFSAVIPATRYTSCGILSAPTITQFKASTTGISYGSSVTLSWTTLNATQILLDNVDVSTVSSKSFSPTVSVKYTLTAKNSVGSVTATVDVAVSAAPIPPSSNGSGLFPSDYPWYADITSSALDAQSASLISALSSRGGWGTGAMKTTFSFNVLKSVASTPTYTVVDLPAESHYTPDCDVNFKFPLPTGGAIEDENGYTCTQDGDCHIIVHDPINNFLYESYRSNLSGGNLQSTCAVKWDLSAAYKATLRGDQCTSTDAAGLPIQPLLFSPDDVFSGEIKHALRFILPNDRISSSYVRPATHGTRAATAGATGLPYGARLRLKASFDISKLSSGAQVVAKAMKKYGIILADGGNIALTATTDQFTTKKWSDVGIDANSFTSIKVTDFEVVNSGSRITVTNNCQRN